MFVCIPAVKIVGIMMLEVFKNMHGNALDIDSKAIMLSMPIWICFLTSKQHQRNYGYIIQFLAMNRNVHDKMLGYALIKSDNSGLSILGQFSKCLLTNLPDEKFCLIVKMLEEQPRLRYSARAFAHVLNWTQAQLKLPEQEELQRVVSITKTLPKSAIISCVDTILELTPSSKILAHMPKCYFHEDVSMRLYDLYELLNNLILVKKNFYKVICTTTMNPQKSFLILMPYTCNISRDGFRAILKQCRRGDLLSLNPIDAIQRMEEALYLTK